MFPRRMMVCVDTPDTFHKCKAELGWFLRKLGSSLVIYHAMHPSWHGLEEVPSTEQLEIEGLINDPALVNIELELESVKTPLNLVDAILETAKERNIDGIIVPTHARKGLSHLLFGSVADQIIKECRIPVFTMDTAHIPDNEDDAPFDHIIVPIDLSDVSEAAIPTALWLANIFGSDVTLLHVVEEYYSVAYPMGGFASVVKYEPQLLKTVSSCMESLADKHRDSTKSDLRVQTRVGHLLESVRELASDYRNPLVVLATAGRDSLGDHVLGSHAERIIRFAGCSVLSLPKIYLADQGDLTAG